MPSIAKNEPKNLFRIKREDGKISLNDHQAVMFSGGSLGLLRKGLVDELGEEQARSFLKKFGYSTGLADGISFKKAFPDESLERLIASGLIIRSLRGIIKLEMIGAKSRIELNNGKFHFEAYGENSREAEQHLEFFGRGETPACWIVAGYLGGYLTAVTGKNILAIETKCRARGDSSCHFMAELVETFSAAFQEEYLNYRVSRVQEYEERKQDFPNIIGNSKPLQNALLMARLAAPVDSTVLLLGESGTGKELLAHGIHKNSQRADKPFIAVNCSALPETLQEAELFGYKKGAFTGATVDQIGLFESADSGTLFLDEIGDLTLTAQTKLLRTLQEGEIKRIGETNVRKVDVRIIASTNKNLEKMVQEKTFREDLYYRLNVVMIKLPPLRERENDLLLLAEHFVKKYAAKFSKKRIAGLSHEATRTILLYPWPGNVRELKHAIERAVILSPGPEISVDELPERVAEVFYHGRSRASFTPGDGINYPATFMDKLTEIEDESERLRMALNLVKGNREKAAALLGISRTTLWRRMQKLKEDKE